MSLLRVTGLTMIATVLVGVASVARAENSGAFGNLAGSWTGTGQMRLEGGKTENLRCRASYTDHDGGNGLGISLRCASASNRVDLHAKLNATGSKISGEWEERQFNAGGIASGTTNGNHISLAINGGGLAGSMSVTTDGKHQSVSITTENVALQGIQIALARD